MVRAWVDAGRTQDAIDLITHKAKEEGKAELLKQMMERATPEDVDEITAYTIRDFIRTFATEEGINIEKGEG